DLAKMMSYGLTRVVQWVKCQVQDVTSPCHRSYYCERGNRRRKELHDVGKSGSDVNAKAQQGASRSVRPVRLRQEWIDIDEDCS
ncbi:hypothetical protein U1Q18_014103, partial [Sarracenia purpurea var. burkii]